MNRKKTRLIISAVICLAVFMGAIYFFISSTASQTPSFTLLDYKDNKPLTEKQLRQRVDDLREKWQTKGLKQLAEATNILEYEDIRGSYYGPLVSFTNNTANSIKSIIRLHAYNGELVFLSLVGNSNESIDGKDKVLSPMEYLEIFSNKNIEDIKLSKSEIRENGTSVYSWADTDVQYPIFGAVEKMDKFNLVLNDQGLPKFFSMDWQPVRKNSEVRVSKASAERKARLLAWRLSMDDLGKSAFSYAYKQKSVFLAYVDPTNLCSGIERIGDIQIISYERRLAWVIKYENKPRFYTKFSRKKLWYSGTDIYIDAETGECIGGYIFG